MNNFTNDDIIIIVKEIINSLKEEELTGYFTDDEYHFPKYISDKISLLSKDEYIKFITSCEKIANNLYGKYNHELNYLNMLHEEILEEIKIYF